VRAGQRPYARSTGRERRFADGLNDRQSAKRGLVGSTSRYL